MERRIELNSINIDSISIGSIHNNNTTTTSNVTIATTILPIKDHFIYEIKSFSNFYMHDENKQQQLIVRFLQFINSSTILHPLYLILYRDTLEYEQRIYPVLRVFIASKDNLEPLLMNTEYKYRQVNINGLPFFSSIRGIKEYATYLKLFMPTNTATIPDTPDTSTSLYARVYTLTTLPSTLYPAWIYQLLEYCPIIVLKITRVEYATAVSSILRLAGMLRATGSKKLELKVQKAEALREALVRQETALFKVTLNAIVLATNIKELQELGRRFKRNMKAQMVKFVAYPFKQLSMLQGREGKELYIELGSLAIAYPFIASDMLELEGIMLGENIITKAPVIWDYRLRDNYNCLILATSGAGKSVTAKLLLTRLLAKYPSAYTYIIDPQGEYERLQSLLEANVIRLTDYQELGLDPFLLFDKVEVADLIADIAEVPDTARKELRVVAPSCSSIFELMNKVSENTFMYIRDLIEAGSPIAVIFKGSSRLARRSIISLKGYAGEAKVTMLLILALAKAWKEINTLPTAIPKILVIDEGWMLFTMPSTARFVNLIARVGRKLNVIFAFITQRPEDVIANEYGRALLDNADTKILLRNNELATSRIGEALQLSREEQNMLVNFLRGEALLLTREYRLRIQIKPTEEELRLFSTSPF